jgi:isopentenyl-diphosphate delta-isomerase
MSSEAPIRGRKREHLDICVREPVEHRRKTTLLEDVELIHEAIPDRRLSDIKTDVGLFNRRLSLPLVIEGMTGGHAAGAALNRDLASVAQALGVALGVGSQRVMIEEPSTAEDFAVRRYAPDVAILGNIGVSQVASNGPEVIVEICRRIDADALCVHLNAPMELVQREGDRDFSGSEKALCRLVEVSPIPVVVKETGCGFSRETALRLAASGVQYLDVGGAGGTSWVGVESRRSGRQEERIGETFWDWGIPTAASLLEVRGAGLHVIASGGIRNGLEGAKALALGACAVGVGLPLARAWAEEGARGAQKWIEAFRREMMMAILLVGAGSVAELGERQVVITGRLREWAVARGLAAEPKEGRA